MAATEQTIGKRIMVMSGKGGVGKSTMAVNLAYSLALSGKTVGILDADIHGPSVAHLTGTAGTRAHVPAEDVIEPIHVHDTLYALSIGHLLSSVDEAVIWRGPMKMSILKEFIEKTQWPPLDILIIDCPPGTGDEPLSLAQLQKIDGVVIVSTPQDLALSDVRKSIVFAKKLELPILGIVENMGLVVCPHCGQPVELFGGEGIARALVDFDIDLLGIVPFDRDMPMLGDKGRPFVYDRGDYPAAIEMKKIAEKIMEKLDL